MPAATGAKRRWAVGLLLAVIAVTVAVFLFLQAREKAPEASQVDAPRAFQDQAEEAGINFRMTFLTNEQGETFKINLYDHGCGVAVGDYDGDGDDDVYLLSQLGPNGLFRNNGDGTFVDVTEQLGVGLPDRISVGATFADYDNDDDQDLFVTSTRGGNVLFQNEGNGTFRDATEEAGLTHVGHSQTAAFFDYDNDGYLDLFVMHTGRWTNDTFDEQSMYYPGKGIDSFKSVIESPKEYNILYHNNRDGTFTDVTEQAGMKGRGWSGDVAVFDYNDDGNLDLYVTCMFGPGQLYRNEGNGTFANVTMQTVGRTPWGGMGVKAFDFNNDAKLDLYIVDMHSDMWMGADVAHQSLDLAVKSETQKFDSSYGPIGQNYEPAQQFEREMADVLGYDADELIYGNALYMRGDDGQFQEASDAAHMETFWPWGIATGDFDNDGDQDAFLPSGMGFPFYYWPNYLMMNNGDGTFTDRAEQTGIEPPRKGIYYDKQIQNRPSVRSSRCAATGDFDGDGRLDLIVNNFNGEPYYFRNRFPERNYVAFRLHGTQSNHDAIGALVTLHVGEEVMQRQVDAAGGYLSHSSKTVHFGLGERATIDWVQIRWPSGVQQRIDAPAFNQLHEIVEPTQQQEGDDSQQ